ncbi:hypothetical protein [Streptomyces wedmorensis]|uniref:hypothetical protein n=1 Tax=Streptomyces wedmorensis TaxID=43759 RepID=UPI0006916A4B|nr:hypothetical protein [Streptomyces wedmorensis]
MAVTVPDWADTLLDLVGVNWPNVDEDAYHFKDMVSAARTIADALDMAAGAIEVMKGKALVELGVLAGQTGLAMALIPVTGGLSALLGAGAIAFTKKQLLKLITAAMEEAGVASGARASTSSTTSTTRPVPD